VKGEALSERDVAKAIDSYMKRVAEFKREMEALGVKVKVTASLGRYIEVGSDGKDKS
jgi:uncharacterized protein with GYD domain